MSWLQLEGAGLAAERWAAGRLRTTPEQGLVILDVPTESRDALATQLARWNFGVHVDSRVRHIAACTGKQFCNIAVTETKAHALRLVEQLRQRMLELHGIRIHMSGCPSACANHHTADIGLKGVRVRRLLGTREGFDVFLGGGVAGRLQLAVPYRAGVDVGQLPNLIDEVVREYYLRHNQDESFSEYWRRELARREPAVTKEEDFWSPVWECDNCAYRHMAQDPPVYCPQCAGLRRNFARLEETASSSNSIATEGGSANGQTLVAAPTDREGYTPAAHLSSIPADRGAVVRIGNEEVAIFRVGDRVVAIDNLCPHAGGSLAEGSFADGCVTCPLHGWKFDVCSGHGIDPTKVRVRKYEAKVVGDQVLIRLPSALTSVT
jgi:nitrite reductase/ring-hydroxylating ferredoxin subunit